jgi:hypothetical protein
MAKIVAVRTEVSQQLHQNSASKQPKLAATMNLPGHLIVPGILAKLDSGLRRIFVVENIAQAGLVTDVG